MESGERGAILSPPRKEQGMGQFQFEWWTVKIKCLTGTYVCEVKAKDREHAIKQFEHFADDVIEVYWETLELDHRGFQRRF